MNTFTAPAPRPALHTAGPTATTVLAVIALGSPGAWDYVIDRIRKHPHLRADLPLVLAP